MRFLADLNLPIAAWLDLDAYGIRMIHFLEEEIGKTILPVGMTVDLWRNGTKRDQTDSQLAKARDLASRMAEEGPLALRDLAAAIARPATAANKTPPPISHPHDTEALERLVSK